LESRQQRHKNKKWKFWFPALLGALGVIVLAFFLVPNHFLADLTQKEKGITPANLNLKKVSAETLDKKKEEQAKNQAEKDESKPAEVASVTTNLPMGKLIAKVPDSGNTVFLTFDDGPSPYTKEIVDILEKNHIQGAFFWVGHNMEFANDAIVQQMLQNGDVIGSHTMDHTSLSHKSLAEQIKLIEESRDYISQKINYPVTFFRPPYGAVDANTYKAATEAHQVIAYWAVDSEDWKYPKNPNKIMSNIMNEVKPGDIILMHEKSHTVKLLQHIIDTLKSKNYQFAALPTTVKKKA
jgi:peptidoglycan-N-acetylglucosamine deacetylase